MSDLISRQVAIDAIHNLYAIHGSEGSWIDQKDAFNALSSLPSAQPEIIRCKDCRWQKDQSGSTAWLPCRALVTPDEFYCGRAERRIDERSISK